MYNKTNKVEEETYVAVKCYFANFPTIVKAIRKMIESLGLSIKDAGYVYYTKAAAEKHYACHKGKNFYPKLVDYIASGEKVYGMHITGDNALEKVDKAKKVIRQAIMESLTEEQEKKIFTNDKNTEEGKDERITKNVIHASDSAEAARNELEIYYELKREKTAHKNNDEKNKE